MKNIVSLSLSGNLLEEFPYRIVELENLKDITLGDGTYGGNKIKVLDYRIGKLKNIHFICLFQNPIDSISPEICNLKKLQYFNISQAKVTSLPKDFGKLINLTTLVLNYTEINKYPEQISTLKKLIYLDISSPNLLIDNYSVFKNFKFIENLTTTLKGQTIIPFDIIELKNIKKLSFYSCQNLNAKNLVKSLKKMKNLKRISLMGSDFTEKEKAYILKKISHIKVDFW